MRITKLGHCCLLIEEDDLRILTDPGEYSTLQSSVKEIDLILISHEHSDHLHIESLQEMLKHNPKAHIMTNEGVGKILKEKNIKFTLLTHGMSKEFRDITIEAFGSEHAQIYEDFGAVENTGYFINDILFYPGDAFTLPPKHVPLLALPVAGPWMKLSEAIKYAREVAPKKCFPVHDGMLIPARGKLSHFLPSKVLPEFDIEFQSLREGESFEFLNERL